ncbi:hypothetical protein ACRAWD_16310 [Caulobacter segnis]
MANLSATPGGRPDATQIRGLNETDFAELTTTQVAGLSGTQFAALSATISAPCRPPRSRR